MGNGAKAQQKRERGKKDASAVANSQLKVNEAAKTVICSVCRSTFLCTVKKNELEIHAENKHGKAFDLCFPNFVEAPSKAKKSK